MEMRPLKLNGCCGVEVRSDHCHWYGKWQQK